MAKLTVVYFSGYGHTRRLAELITAGAASVAGESALSVAIDREGNLSNDTWVLLHSQDALIFGSRTYNRRRLHQLGGDRRRQVQHHHQHDQSRQAARDDLDRHRLAAGQPEELGAVRPELDGRFCRGTGTVAG